MKTIELTKKEYVAPKSKCVEIEEELLLQASREETYQLRVFSGESDTYANGSQSMESRERGTFDFDFGFDE